MKKEKDPKEQSKIQERVNKINKIQKKQKHQSVLTNSEENEQIHQNTNRKIVS